MSARRSGRRLAGDGAEDGGPSSHEGSAPASQTPSQQQQRRRQTNNSLSTVGQAELFTALPTDTSAPDSGVLNSGGSTGRAQRAAAKRSASRDVGTQDELEDDLSETDTQQRSKRGKRKRSRLADASGPGNGEAGGGGSGRIVIEESDSAEDELARNSSSQEAEDDKRAAGGKDTGGEEEDEEEEDEEAATGNDSESGRSPRRPGRPGRKPNPHGVGDSGFKKAATLKESFPVPDSEEPDAAEVERLRDKVDADGSLLDPEMVYLCQTFRIPSRHPSRLYGLCSDLARVLNFRSSFWFLAHKRSVRRLEATLDELTEVAQSPEHRHIITPQTKHRGANMVSIFDVYAAYGDAVTISRQLKRQQAAAGGSGGLGGGAGGVGGGAKAGSGYLQRQAQRSRLAAADLSGDPLPPRETMPWSRQRFYFDLAVTPARAAAPHIPQSGSGAVAGEEDGSEEQKQMAGVARAAADFNSRLRSERQQRAAFTEEHTTRRHVARNTQPTTVVVHSAGLSSSAASAVAGRGAGEPPLLDFEPAAVLEQRVARRAGFVEHRWHAFRATAGEPGAAYPIAVAPGQYQDAFSV